MKRFALCMICAMFALTMFAQDNSSKQMEKTAAPSTVNNQDDPAVQLTESWRNTLGLDDAQVEKIIPINRTFLSAKEKAKAAADPSNGIKMKNEALQAREESLREILTSEQFLKFKELNPKK